MIINTQTPAFSALWLVQNGFRLLCFFLLLHAFSCRPAETGNQEENRVKEMAGGLPGGRAFELDSLGSELAWTLRKNDGTFLRGSFKPGRGYVLLEGKSLAAGFFEGDIWNNNSLKDSAKTPTLGAMKFLQDSLPVLFSSRGRKIRFDLKQTSRVIPRSEFRSLGIQDSLSPTHDLQFQAEIADSSQALRIPLRLRMKAKELYLSGHCQLNLREFGILYKPQLGGSGKQWIPEASLEFRLHFRESR